MELRFRRHLVAGLTALLCATVAPAQNPKTYGSATPGSKGLVPVLKASGAPRIDDRAFSLTITKGRPGATAIVFVGLAEVNRKVGTVRLLLDPSKAFPLPTITLDKNGKGVYRLPLPDDPDAVGVKFFAQAFLSDDGVFGGVAASAGLAATVLNKPSVLPIEVLGAEGIIESVHVDLGSNHKKAARLWLQINNLSHDGEASVRVNDGRWTDLTNSNKLVAIAEPDRSYGGIGGGFHTIRMGVAVPSADYKAGLNTIAFRFNTSRNKTVGFRVLDLQVRDSSGVDLLKTNAFELADPSTWVAPRDTPADLRAGADLWFGKGPALIDHYNSGSRKILASCADCHARDGRDLKYYNYSNRSIVERSKFHGLSTKQGEQIASYIRNLQVAAPKSARPWNPPFQPGVGTDSKPASEWAAGAGLAAVLPSDKAMLPYLFGKGSDNEIASAASTKGQLNLRDMPISLQFPDWKRWLPEVHPLDIWGRSYFEKGSAHQRYEVLRATLQNGVPKQLVATFDEFQENVTMFLRPRVWWGAGWTNDTGSNTPTLLARDKRYSAEYAKYNLALWAAVKQWELVQTYELYDEVKGPDAEARQFPTLRFTTFHIAPHLIGDQRRTSHFVGQAPVVGAYMSSIWYQVQATLSPGSKQGDAVEPVDWAYNYQHVLLLGQRSGVLEPLRYFQNIIKGYQQRNLGVVDDYAWTMREVSPWRLYSNYNGDQSTHAALNSYTTAKQLRVRVTNALLDQWLGVSEAIPVKDWPRSTPGEGLPYYWYTLETSSYMPVLDPSKNLLTHKNLFARDGSYSAIEADAMARLLDKRLTSIGVDCKLQKRLAAWSKQFWPRYAWAVDCK